MHFKFKYDVKFMSNLTITGLYAGIYLTQNYNVPVVPDPTSLIDKAKKFLEENKKPDKGE